VGKTARPEKCMKELIYVRKSDNGGIRSPLE